VEHRAVRVEDETRVARRIVPNEVAADAPAHGLLRPSTLALASVCPTVATWDSAKIIRGEGPV
jgi:hypothetical protein